MMTPGVMMRGLTAECHAIAAQRDQNFFVPAIVESTTNRIAILNAACDFIHDHANSNVGDLPVASSPAVPSSGTPEPPARQTSLDHEVHGDTQASSGLPLQKYRVSMIVTASWMEQGRPKSRVIKFHADEQECGDLMPLLFHIEQAINSSATAYALRAHVAAEES